MTGKENNHDLLKRSLQAINVLQEKLQQEEKRNKEPIAVIGMGCRFPGGSNTPEAFWELLKEGKDGISEIPPDRWDPGEYYNPDPKVPGKMYVNRAGFLHGEVGEFDARFFGISPREAIEMDPQQRLLMEVSWEALERAGVVNKQLRGSNSGVFVGITGSDYAGFPRSLEKVDPYTITGSVPNIASGRIANNFGFHGPAYSIDTACSSSLVAVHLACDSLRKGECEMALAGGVGMILAPHPFILLCKMNALSKDGKCKTFDAKADGYVRAEGCGMVVLKPLSTAQKQGSPILAVIKGSAVNHDGATSGLTVPSGQAQTQLIRKALDNAGVTPAEISFLETHGTGTNLGDPVEVQAIAEVFAGKIPGENPLVLGAVKSNIGHLEAAAGIAGLIKVILNLRHQIITPNLHYKTLNPRINLEKIPAVIPTAAMKWESRNRPRIGGISSFGFSGTNAHLIVSEAPTAQQAPAQPPQSVKSSEIDRPLHILALSAKNENALQQMIKQYKDYLEKHENTDIRLQDVCYTANACRRHFPWRAVYAAEDKTRMKQHLAEPPLARATPGDSQQTMLAFVFNSGPWDGKEAGNDLYKTFSCYREAYDASAALFQPYTGHLPVEVTGQTNSIKDNGHKQARLFCMQYALVQLWDRWGVRPTAVMGEGIGEYAAACTAGIMTLETAVKYAARQMGLTPNETKIPGELKPPKLRFISTHTGEVPGKTEITQPAYWQDRSPVSTGLNGLKKGINNLKNQGYGIFVEIGAGTHCLDRAGLDQPGEKAAAPADPQRQNPWETLIKSAARLYCSGVEIDWQEFDADFQRTPLELPTYPFQRRRFWLESYPGTGKNTNKTGGKSIDTGKHKKMQEKLEKTVKTGCDKKAESKINTNSTNKEEVVNMSKDVNVEETQSPPGESTAVDENRDPFEGTLVRSPLEDKQFEYRLDTVVLPELKHNHNVLHVGYYMEILGRLIGEYFGADHFAIRDLQYRIGLAFTGEEPRTVTVTLGAKDLEGVSKFQFFSQGKNDESWLLHARGTMQLLTGYDVHKVTKENLEKIQARCGVEQEGTEFHQDVEKRFGKLGPSVKWADQVWCSEGEVLARLRCPEESEEKQHRGLKMHPGVLDTCAQMFHRAGGKHLGDDDLFSVVKAEEIIFQNREIKHPMWFHLQVEDEMTADGNMRGQSLLFDNEGEPVATTKGIELKVISKERHEEIKKAFGKETIMAVKDDYSEILDMVIMSATTEEQIGLLGDYLRAQIAIILKMDESEISKDEKLMDLGIDSLVSVELKNVIERDMNIDIALQYLYETPTIAKLAEVLLQLLPGQMGERPHKFFTEEIKRDADSWLAFRKPVPDAKVRLFCFPYGVRGASLYREWQAKMADFIEVCPIQIPGKENRIREIPMEDMNLLIDYLAEAIKPLLDRPFAIYGHSGGAFFAYRAAYRFWLDKEPHLKHLFPAAFASPLTWPNPGIVLSISAFKACGFNGIPRKEEVQNMTAEKRRELWEYYGILFDGHLMPDEAKQAVEPMVIGEYRMFDEFVPDENEKVFDVPITAFHGKNDIVCSEVEIRTWKALTTNHFKTHILNGTHMFLHADECQDELLKLITEDLEAYT